MTAGFPRNEKPRKQPRERFPDLAEHYGEGGLCTGKAWGLTLPCIVTPLIELRRIYVKPNMHCSLHVHERKWNAFIVTRGIMHIDVHKSDYNPTTLGPGGVTTVAPGEKHQFRTGPEGAEVYELYYLEPLGPDIKRDCEGGPNEE